MGSSHEPNDPWHAAIATLERAHQSDPRTSPFGMFLSADHPSGIGMFHWFESELALIEALTRLIPLAFADADDPAVPARIARLVETAERFAAAERTGPACLAALQVHLRGTSSIDWVGSFEELRASDAAWPADLRERFRDDEREVNEGELDTAEARRAPINAEELDDFIEFARRFGH